jgi:hypothetical protein
VLQSVEEHTIEDSVHSVIDLNNVSSHAERMVGRGSRNNSDSSSVANSVGAVDLEVGGEEKAAPLPPLLGPVHLQARQPFAVRSAVPDNNAVVPIGRQLRPREMQKLVAMRHPHLVSVMGVTTTPDRSLCLVMEQLEQGSLSELLQVTYGTDTPPPPSQAALASTNTDAGPSID